MKNGVLYIKIEQNTEVLNKKIFLQDFAKLYCSNNSVLKDLKRTVFWTTKKNEDTKYMFSIMKVIEVIQKKYPKNAVNTTKKAFPYSNNLFVFVETL